MKLPKKYRVVGLHVWCNTHKKVVTSRQDEHSSCSLSYQSRIWNPHSKRRIVKTWAVETAAEAVDLHIAFRKELEANDYYLVQNHKPTDSSRPKLLVDGVKRYKDYLADKNVLESQRKSLSRKHINMQSKMVDSFLLSLKMEGYRTNLMQLTIDDEHADVFYRYLQQKSYANKTFNEYVKACIYMFKYFVSQGWAYDSYDQIPFRKIKSKRVVSTPRVITEEELSRLFDAITESNSWSKKGNKNRYRPWLKDAFKLALYTGARAHDVFQIKWKNVEENYIIYVNTKVTKLDKNEAEYRSSVPISKDIAEFLVGLGPGNSEEYLINPMHANRKTVQEFASKAFRHFWDIANPNHAEFKDFRSTHITRIVSMLGEKSVALGTHRQMETQIKHYLGKQEITKELINVSLWDIGVT